MAAAKKEKLVRVKCIRTKGDFKGIKPGGEGKVPEWMVKAYPTLIERVKRKPKAPAPAPAAPPAPEPPEPPASPEVSADDDG